MALPKAYLCLTMHQGMKHASDAITAKGMAKGVSQFYLFLCVLTLCLPSSQVWLDACTEQATHP
jgi:hypothetical protein